MVWKTPQPRRMSGQEARRIGLVWGLLVVLVGASLGVQVVTRGQARVELGEAERAGELSARLPAGWEVERVSSPPTLIARKWEPSPREVRVTLLRGGEAWATPQDYLRAEFRERFLDPPRPVRVGGWPGSMAVTISEPAGPAPERIPGLGPLVGEEGGWFGHPLGPGFLTVAVGVLPDGGVIWVQAVRWDGLDSRDAVLVREVGRGVSLVEAAGAANTDVDDER